MDDDHAGRPAIERFVDLARMLQALPPSCGRVRLVAIDGPAGAGKSTFADRLARALTSAPIVHTDDFASWDHPFDWFPRLRAQVVEAFASGGAGRYQRYDWVRREFADWVDVPAAPVVLVEGVGAARREITAAVAFAIWIETPPAIRFSRGIERDGEALRDFWVRWTAGEKRHFAADRTRERADLVAAGSSLLPHDPAQEYVRLLNAAT